jgi:Mlc titration factor MtfA (ptsG expression regulator)
MDNFKKFIEILWILFFLFIFLQIILIFKRKKELQKLKSKPLNENLKKYIVNLPEYKKLPEKYKKIIEFKIQLFLKEKKFIGININLTDEIKTLIAFYACLPTVAYENFCYPDLKYIYVYPYPVILKGKQNGYVISNEEFLISGEAVGESAVIVWNEAKKEIYRHLGRNVIIHEFAHELDFEEGTINGIPPLQKSKYAQWTKIMFSEYEKFKKNLLKNRFLGKYSLIDKYAATNPAEFFAVMSEYYFENPQKLKKHFPDIYKELKEFYKLEFL